MDIVTRLAEISGPNQRGWAAVRHSLWGQREIRRKLFEMLSELDRRVRDAPETFVFPDPYSLLLWVWTFQLFEESFCRYGDWSATKYYYRGEHRDFGVTRCEPTLSRSPDLTSWRHPNTPGRIRKQICDHLRWHHKCGSSSEKRAYVRLSETMSPAQAIAVGQHYGCPTPLLDVTIQPEVALYFATAECDGRIGFLHFFKLQTDTARDAIGEMVLVMAPPQFTRIHAQSGYFLCSRPGVPLRDRFSCLKFLQSPDVSPVRPTWVWSPHREVSAESRRIPLLNDELRLERAFKRELASTPEAPKLPTPSLLKDFDSRRMLYWMLPAYINATSHSGISADGRVVFQFDPALTYAFNRFSPIHCYMYMAALIADKLSGKLAAGVAAHLQLLLDQFRSLMVVEGDVDASATIRTLDDVDTLRLMGKVIGSGDQNIIPYPLSKWYSD